MTNRPGKKVRLSITVAKQAGRRSRLDQVAVEEPLEIRLLAGRERKTIAVTMRTPGADFELAAGFLYSEGVIANRADIRTIRYCLDPAVDTIQQYNIVNVTLARQQLPDLPQLERHFYTSSACGVCGKAGIEALQIRGGPAIEPGLIVTPQTLFELPTQLSSNQRLFADTGGVHAAGLFTVEGKLVALREDVGRHNALDKLIGWALMQNRLPLSDHLVMVSGRASYEILQKCVAAGLPMVCSVSAPSSLAVEVARSFGITLIGFLRGETFNIYTGAERVAYDLEDALVSSTSS
jgi:FdhD protein